MKTNYTISKNPKRKVGLDCGGAMIRKDGKVLGEIDIWIRGQDDVSMNLELTLKEAKAFSKILASEIEEVEFRIKTGKWKYELK